MVAEVNEDEMNSQRVRANGKDAILLLLLAELWRLSAAHQ